MVFSKKKDAGLMKIAIDARLYNQSGIGRYTRGLISNLEKIDQKNEYYILLKSNEYKKETFAKNFHKVLADFTWYGVSEQIKMPPLLRSLNVDLVHFPHFNIPVFYKGKFVVTVHDLIHQHFQMHRATTRDPITYRIKQLGYDKIFGLAVKRSEKILVPSEFVKKSLIKEWDVDTEKITVTHEAADREILSMERSMSSERSLQILDKLGVKLPYLFYVGNAHPHKNIEGLIKAFLILRESHPDLILVLSGQDHYFWNRLKEESQEQGILYTGEISDEELVALYKNAICFVHPSFEEGFGIPLLEAMACSCPVVASNAASLPEVAKDAAIYFNPNDLKDMVKKISQVIENKKLRKDLITKGQKRYKEFSWEKLAKQTLDVYETEFVS
ncbi:MAG: glycosyltransferase family 1 protein [Candidatus Daviesbacteria bacterium]|nr:glycosyltransferase family 1 protein [Candidatus Daviesbacteria bacterium]